MCSDQHTSFDNTTSWGGCLIFETLDIPKAEEVIRNDEVRDMCCGVGIRIAFIDHLLSLNFCLLVDSHSGMISFLKLCRSTSRQAD